jgi:acyl-CoA reductase-like NAD-dependent aldehyde dehydrogenase
MRGAHVTEATEDLTGGQLLAGTDQPGEGQAFRAVDPRTGDEFGPTFHDASVAQTDAAVRAAAAAAPALAATTLEERARLLETMAHRLEEQRELLAELGDAETALGLPRLNGELSRTTYQLGAFAAYIRDGSYLGSIIDPADPDAAPVPRPDLRRMRIPLGPVAVFGASNFPLAFSVAGGDTASAIAAGCPVVVKGHPSHPQTSEVAARALIRAVADVGLPAGTFSLLHGRAIEVGQALVQAEALRAVGFTGSESAGRALYDLGASREVPIPVYAEMGSLNPVFVTAATLTARADAIAEGLAGSVSLGNGQFCTKPGLVFVPDDHADELIGPLAEQLTGIPSAPMLNPGIGTGLDTCLDASMSIDGVEVLVAPGDHGPTDRGPSLLVTDLDTFLAHEELRREHFGPATIVIRSDPERWEAAAAELPGSLTATIHGEEDDHATIGGLVRCVTDRAGRIVWNGYPTGVAVTSAQHHGGPYPATTITAYTSVGATAIDRWLRSVAYQNCPDVLLPPALQDANPLGILRLVDGRWSRDPVDRNRSTGGVV